MRFRPRRKILVYALLGLFGVLAGLAVYAYIRVTRPEFAEAVARRAETEAARRTGGTLTIGSLEIQPVLPRIRVRDVKFESPGRTVNVYLKRGDLRIGAVGSLLRRGVSISNVVLDGLTVELLGASSGPKSETPGGSPWKHLALDRLVVRNGAFVVNRESLPFTLTLDDVDAALGSGVVRSGLQGRVRASRLGIAFRGRGNGVSLALETQFAVADSMLRFKTLRLDSAELCVQAAGSIDFSAGPEYDFNITSTYWVPQLIRLANWRQPFDGSGSFEGTLSGKGKDFALRGTVACSRFCFRQYEMLDVETPFLYTRNLVEAPDIRGVHCRGMLEGTFRRTSGPEGRTEFTAAIEGANFMDLMAEIGLSKRSDPLESLADLQFAVGWPNGKEKKLTGTGIVTLTAPGGPCEQDHTCRVRTLEPVAFDIDWHATTILFADIAAYGFETQAAGRFGFDKSLHIKATAAPAQLQDAVRLFRRLQEDLFSHDVTWQLPADGSAFLDGMVTGSLPDPHVTCRFDIDEARWRDTCLGRATGNVEWYRGTARFTDTVLRAPPPGGQADITAVLGERPGQEHTWLDLDARFRRWSLATSLDLFAVALPLDAAMTGPLWLTGPLVRPEGAASVILDGLPSPLSALGPAAADARIRTTGMQCEISAHPPGGGTATLSGWVGFDDGKYRVRGRADGIDMEALSMPGNLRGTIDLQVQGEGRFTAPRLHLDVDASELQAFGIDLEKADGRADLVGTEIAFHAEGPRWVIDGETDSRTGRIEAAATTERLPLFLSHRSLPWVAETLMDVDARVTRAARNEPLEVSTDVAFILPTQRSGKPDIFSGSLRLSGRKNDLCLSFSGETTQRWLVAQGELHFDPTEGYPLSTAVMRFDLQDAPVENFLPATGLSRALKRASLTGRVTAAFSTVSGERRIEGNISKADIQVGRYSFANQTPFLLSIGEDRFTITDTRWKGEELAFELGGELDLRRRRILRFNADGVMPLALLDAFFSDVRASGPVEVHARISGGLTDPSAQGRFSLTGGAISFTGFVYPIEDIRADGTFSREVLHLERFAGKVAGGEIKAGGDLYFSVDRSTLFTVSGTLENVKFELPAGLFWDANATLEFSRVNGEYTLAGDAKVNHAVYKKRVSTKTIFDEPLAPEQGLVLGPLMDTRLFIDMTSDNTLEVNNNLGLITGSGEVDLLGTIADPTLFGRLQVTGGQLYYGPNRYSLTSGSVEFFDPDRARPFVDITAQSRIGRYDVSLTFTGFPDSLGTRYASSPPLDEEEVVRLVIGQGELSPTSPGSGDLAGTGATRYFTGRFTEAIEQTAEQVFGFTRFQIDPYLVAAEANPTARLTFGRKIARNLEFVYSTNFVNNQEQVMVLEYTPKKDLSIVTSRDEDGSVGVDVKFRKRF